MERIPSYDVESNFLAMHISQTLMSTLNKLEKYLVTDIPVH